MNNTYEGKVVSTKNSRTIVVEVIHAFRHPLYKKAVNRSQRFAVDTGSKTFTVGETVKIAETRPMSKKKHFKVV